MQLTVLGSNATFPTPGRPASGYLLEHEGTRIWLDAGFGTFAALQDVIDFRTLDAVVVSHVHADHSADLIGFYHATKYGTEAPRSVPVYAPDLVAERLGYYLGGAGYEFNEVLVFTTVGDADSVEVGDVRLDFAITDHLVPTVAVRASTDDGRVLAYSSDTGPAGSWHAIAADADVFVVEATFQGQDKPFPHHLSASEAGTIGRDQRVRRLVLAHIWPFLDPARSVEEAEHTFGKPVELAAPGRTIRI